MHDEARTHDATPGRGGAARRTPPVLTYSLEPSREIRASFQ
jgi:hypothetical protein